MTLLVQRCVAHGTRWFCAGRAGCAGTYLVDMLAGRDPEVVGPLAPLAKAFECAVRAVQHRQVRAPALVARERVPAQECARFRSPASSTLGSPVDLIDFRWYARVTGSAAVVLAETEISESHTCPSCQRAGASCECHCSSGCSAAR